MILFVAAIGIAICHCQSTINPTVLPTIQPSINPTNEPTYYPTNKPTELPSKYPSIQPSTQPTSNPTDIPTEYPTKAPTATQILAVSPLNQHGECENPGEAVSRYDYISLSECIDLCESVIWNDCIMIQYYDKLQSDADSRCYIFDQICYLSQDVGKRVNTSHIYYKNQLTKQYCVDYRDWTDKYTDGCNAYVTHGLCVNGKMTDKATLNRFEEAKDPIYGWTALDVCCECGGGKSVYDDIAVSFVNEYNYDDKLAECSFKEDIINITDLAKWNNFALFQLMEGINDQFYKQYPLNTDLFIYTDLVDHDNSHSYKLIICDFSLYDINATSKELYTDFFIFGSTEFDQQSVYFINSEYFEMDLVVLPDVIKVQSRDFRYCNSQIVNASKEDTAIIDMILPCFYQYVVPTSVPTKQPDIINVIKEPETFWEKYVYPIDDDNWIYWIIVGGSLCVLITFCMFCCCVRKQKRKQDAESKQMKTQFESAPSYTQLTIGTVTNSTHTVSNVFTEKAEEGTPDDLSDDDITDDDDDDEIEIDENDIDEVIPMLSNLEIYTEAKQARKGILFYQYGFYDEKQMKNIDNRWHNNIDKGPRLLFGDNIVDKRRGMNVKRKKYGGQSKIVGHWDRLYGFGIPTTFEEAESVQFIANDHNYRELLKFEFMKLKDHIKNGGDIVVPYPSENDLKTKPNKYYRNGKGKQLIHHNLGTGISSLKFEHICLIEQHIRELKDYANEVRTVYQILYNDEDKKEQHGLLVYQSSWYTEEQMAYIYNEYNTKKKLMGAPKMLFGENDIDKFRETNVSRQYLGGQAGIMGPYDRSIAYGIVTTFYKCTLPKIGEFYNFMDKHFQPLQQHLLNGYDVIIPIPRKDHILRNKKKYFKDGKQKIFHNIGTGISQLPFEYIEYIQFQIDELKKYARNVKEVKYYNYSPKMSVKLKKKNVKKDKLKKEDDVKMQINNGQIIYQCPLCCENVHYLMKFKNCKHSVCEPCLRNYIIQHLDYLENNEEEYRFKCWAAKISNCPNGQICLEDVNIPNDKCYCKQCKINNSTDTGNGTILDDESYKQFKDIMIAFSTKSQWDTDECPNCKKPFPIPREWRKKQQSETKGYYYRQKTIYFADINIDEDKCNCCGKKINQYQNEIRLMMDNDDEMEEIAITAYQTHNNCTICKHYYCDDCRSNCFYEIERDYTVRPPSPVHEAMIDFNRSEKLRKADFQKSEFERIHKNKKKKNMMGYIPQPFECCEVCWYRFYCRKCPHCNHKFCGICDAKWNGCTADWNYKIKQKQNDDDNDNDNEDDEKYGGDNIYKLIDEKNEKHDMSSHHSCNEEILKVADIERKKKKSREQKKNEQFKMIHNRLQDTETRYKSIQREVRQKEKKYDKLKQERKQKEMELISINKDKDRKLLEAQKQNELLKNKILELQKATLIKEKDIFKNKIITTEMEKLQIIKEKEEVNSEKEKYKKEAEEEKKQRIDKEKEYQDLQKKLFVRVWQWKENNGKWIQYDDNISKKIEELKHFESHTFTVDKNNQSYKVTRTGDTVGNQINSTTNVSREIRRIEQSRGYIEYPKWWNVEGLQLNDDDDEGGGISTGADYARPQLINMNLNDNKAKEVANAFYNTSKHSYPNIKITQIESVENQRLYDKYWSERSILKKSSGENKLNERYLWHGTRTEDTMGTIEKQGFRKEFNSTAYWGKGTYFAVNAGYSVGYSSNNNGIYKMFQCKVLCGESTVGNSSYELKTWPKKSNGLIYDSLVSNNNDIYVIHDDVRAYPMFVITFRTN